MGIWPIQTENQVKFDSGDSFFAYSATSQFLNHYIPIDNWSLEKKFRWHLDQNIMIYLQEI